MLARYDQLLAFKRKVIYWNKIYDEEAVSSFSIQHTHATNHSSPRNGWNACGTVLS